MSDAWTRIELAGLWKQKSKGGKPYYAGKINDRLRIEAWPNEAHQENPKAPAVRVVLVQMPPKKQDTQEEPSDDDGYPW